MQTQMSLQTTCLLCFRPMRQRIRSARNFSRICQTSYMSVSTCLSHVLVDWADMKIVQTQQSSSQRSSPDMAPSQCQLPYYQPAVPPSLLLTLPMPFYHLYSRPSHSTLRSRPGVQLPQARSRIGKDHTMSLICKAKVMSSTMASGLQSRLKEGEAGELHTQ